MSNKWYGKQDKDLMQEIIEYAQARKYKMPNTWEALGWVNAELGEVYEVLLSTGGWVRNNPQDHPEKGNDEFAEELGDVIFMVMIAGHSKGVNPLEAMKEKMSRKLIESSVKKAQTGRIVSGVSSVVPVTDEEAERIFKEVDENEN